MRSPSVVTFSSILFENICQSWGKKVNKFKLRRNVDLKLVHCNKWKVIEFEADRLACRSGPKPEHGR